MPCLYFLIRESSFFTTQYAASNKERIFLLSAFLNPLPTPIKSVPLFDHMMSIEHPRHINRLRARIKLSIDISPAISKCTAGVVKHVNKIPYFLAVA